MHNLYCHDGQQFRQIILVQMRHQNFQSRSRWTVYNKKWMIIVLWFSEHESVGHSPQVHWLRQIQGPVDGVLLTSVRTWDHYPWSWIGRITEHTEASIHTTMCIPEQHREPTARAITRVEWHIGNTHSSEVNARNPFFSRSGGQVCRFLFVLGGKWLPKPRQNGFQPSAPV